MYNNSITDISVLKGCEKMTALDVGNNAVRDISCLEDMKNLECLCLSHNNISDLTALENLDVYKRQVVLYERLT